MRQVARKWPWVTLGVAGAVAALGQAPVSFPLATVLGLAVLFWLVASGRGASVSGSSGSGAIAGSGDGPENAPQSGGRDVSQALVGTRVEVAGKSGSEAAGKITPRNVSEIAPRIAPEIALRTAPEIRPGRAAFVFGFGYFAVALHWIVEPFLVDPVRHGWMAPFALMGLAAGLAMLWAVAGWATRGRGVLALAAALCLAELARSYILTGFPWALLGHVWVGWGPAQMAAWVGPIGLTAFTVFLPALVVALWGRWRWLGVVVVFALGVPVLAVLGAPPMTVPPFQETVVRLIQPNAPQHLKWHPDHARGFFERQVNFTAAGVTRPDLIIWPETAIPAVLNQAGFALDRMAEAAAGVPVIFGIQRFDAGLAYNSLVVMDGAGAVAEIYDKAHLVPFGEYIPGLGLLRFLPFAAFVEEHGFGYAPGPGARVLDLDGLGADAALGKILPLICYEAVFPQDLRTATRPDWVLQITNDAWFGDFAGPYQHLAQARLRAIELGLPVVRVANTGVSAVIDARGQVVQSLALNQAGYLDVPVPASFGPTVYSRTGDWPVALFLIGVFTVLLLCRSKPD